MKDRGNRRGRRRIQREEGYPIQRTNKMTREGKEGKIHRGTQE